MLRSGAWKYDLQESLDFLDDSGEFSDSESPAFLESLVDRDWATLDTYFFYGYVVTREDFYAISKERPSSDRLEYLAKRLPLAERMEWMCEIRKYANPDNDKTYRTNMLIFAALLKATPSMDSSATTFMKNGFRNLYLKAVDRLDVNAMKAFYNGAGGLPLKRAFFDAKFPSVEVLKARISRTERHRNEDFHLLYRRRQRYIDIHQMIRDVIKQLLEHGADPNLRIPREEANRQSWVFNPEQLWESVSWDIEMPPTVCALEGASLIKFEFLLRYWNTSRLISLSEKEKEYYLFTQILSERQIAIAAGKKPCSDFLLKFDFDPPYYCKKFLTADRMERTLFRMDDPVEEVDHFVSALVSCGTADAMWAVSDRTLSWKAAVPEVMNFIVDEKSKDYPKFVADEDWLVRAHISLEDEYKWGNQVWSVILDCFQIHDHQAEILSMCILDFCNFYSMNQEFRNLLKSPRNHILGSYCFEGELEGSKYKTCTAPVSRWILQRYPRQRCAKDALQCIRNSYHSKNHIGLCKSDNLHKIFNSAERNRKLFDQRIRTLRGKLKDYASNPLSAGSLIPHQCGCILCQPDLYTYDGWGVGWNG